MIDNPWGEEPAWACGGEEKVAAAAGSEDQGDEEDSSMYLGAQHVLVLVDGASNSTSWGDSSLDASLKACQQLCQTRVLQVATFKSGKRDAVGVALYGVTQRPRASDDDEHPEEEHDDDHEEEDTVAVLESTHTLIELGAPGIPQIKALRSFPRDYHLSRDDDVRHQGRYLRTALQYANKTFLESKLVKNKASGNSPADLRSIWIFTTNDAPFHSESELRQMQMILDDIVEGGTQILVWPLVTDFDATRFYSPHCLVQEPVADTDDLLERISYQGKKPRRLWNLPLYMGRKTEEPAILVDVYKVVVEQKKPQLKWINQETMQETERVTQTIVKDTGEVLRTTGDATATQQLDRILQFATLGLERIPLSPADVLQIKKASHNFCDSACIIVHGFQPLCELSVAHFLDTSYILYPTDLKHQGSVEACTNLVAAMLETQVYAVAQLLVRTTAIPRLCALVPQDDLTLVMTMLPYQDDLRQVEPEARAVEVSSELVEKAVDLIEHQRLQNVEIGVNFVNASIEKFWSYIEAVALETSLPEPEQYEVELNEEEVLKAAGPQIDAFRDALPEDVPTKKSSSSSSRSTQPRKRKALVVDESGQDWRYLYTTGSIDSCSMDDLKSYLRSVGARVGGKKDDLVRRVRQSILERIEKDGF